MYKVQFISLWYVPKILCDIVSNIAHFGQVCNARHAEWPLGHYSTEKEKMTRFHTNFVLQTYFHSVGIRNTLQQNSIKKSLNAQKVTQNSDVHYELWSPLLPKLWWLCSISFFYLIGTNDLALHLNFYWFLTWDNFSI